MTPNQAFLFLYPGTVNTYQALINYYIGLYGINWATQTIVESRYVPSNDPFAQDYAQLVASADAVASTNTISVTGGTIYDYTIDNQSVITQAGASSKN